MQAVHLVPMLLRGNVFGPCIAMLEHCNELNAGGTPALQGVAHARKRGRL